MSKLASDEDRINRQIVQRLNEQIKNFDKQIATAMTNHEYLNISMLLIVRDELGYVLTGKREGRE